METLTKTPHDLSERQQRILDYVTLVITRDDRSPTLREIQEACNISSSSVASYNLDILAKRGLLLQGAYGESRGYKLPVNPWRQLAEDAAYILGLLDGVDYGGFIAGHIAGWRERRAKLIRG